MAGVRQDRDGAALWGLSALRSGRDPIEEKEKKTLMTKMVLK